MTAGTRDTFKELNPSSNFLVVRYTELVHSGFYVLSLVQCFTPGYFCLSMLTLCVQSKLRMYVCRHSLVACNGRT